MPYFRSSWPRLFNNFRLARLLSRYVGLSRQFLSIAHWLQRPDHLRRLVRVSMHLDSRSRDDESLALDVRIDAHHLVPHDEAIAQWDKVDPVTYRHGYPF